VFKQVPLNLLPTVAFSQNPQEKPVVQSAHSPAAQFPLLHQTQAEKPPA
jgi:hypothetical protein